MDSRDFGLLTLAIGIALFIFINVPINYHDHPRDLIQLALMGLLVGFLIATAVKRAFLEQKPS